MPALTAPAKPRLCGSGSSVTSGNCARTRSGEPSVDALSTTMIRAGWLWPTSDRRQSPRNWMPFQLGITTAARATAGSVRPGYDGRLEVNLDAPLPPRIAVGSGTALFIHGTCFDRERKIETLAFRVGGEEQPVRALGMPRLDYFRALHPRLDAFSAAGLSSDPDSDDDPLLHSYRSGFWGLVRIDPGPPGATLEVLLRARFAEGREQEAYLGRLEVASP